MKVALVFEKSYLELPSFNDGFLKEIEVELPAGVKQAHLISARCYQPDGGVANTIGGDINACILRHRDVSDLVGKLLTYVDATFTDAEQRKAHKDIVKGLVYDWHNSMTTRAFQIVDAHQPHSDQSVNQ